MELTLQMVRDWAGLLNMLLVPLVIYIVRIENKLTLIMTLFGAHEISDTDKFNSIFRRLEYLERRQGRP